jgi:biopolymer transport protein ExbD
MPGSRIVANTAPFGGATMTTYGTQPRLTREPLADAASGMLCEINTTPLIDIMLVLLITLIIALPLMTHGVSIELPHAAPPQQTAPPEVIDLDIEFDGTVLWNGTVMESLQQLARYLRSEAPKDPQPQMRLRPDPRARYDTVAKVLALAQQNGLKRVGFIDTVRYQD